MELTEYEKEKRSGDPNYFMNGKPKKSAMMCRNKSYQSEIIRINGYFDLDWCCAGNICPLYSTGCDNKGRDWD